MSNTSIRGFYLVMDKIKDELLNEVNTVTTGDITEIDLSKQTIFPLSHIIVNNVTSSENMLTFSVSILSMDVVDQSKEATSDLFRGNNNEQDILNTQLAVLDKVIQKFRISSIYQEGYQVTGDATLEPFYDRFENQIAGWTATFDLMIANDIDIC